MKLGDVVDSLQTLGLTDEDVMQGKYLTFNVGYGEYGIEINYVTEIIGVQEITPIPHTFDYVKGIINLRGTIVPIIDMRLRFGLDENEYTERTCIIVLSMGSVIIGLIVDEVQEVLDIDDESIQKPPASIGGTVQHSSQFIKAIGLHAESVKQLLDVNVIFEVDDENAPA